MSTIRTWKATYGRPNMIECDGDDVDLEPSLGGITVNVKFAGSDLEGDAHEDDEEGHDRED